MLNNNLFPWLSLNKINSKGLQSFSDDLCLHVLFWRILNDNPDHFWYHRLIDFKRGSPVALEGAKKMMSQAVPYLLEKWDINDRSVGMLIAMGHDETRVMLGKPLPILAKHICENLPNIHWYPDLLEKDVHEKSTGQSGARKDQVVSGKYRCKKLPPDITSVIVMDDLVTRGATLSEIARAVRCQNQSVNIHPIALGKNERRGFLLDDQDADNKHLNGLFPNINQIWPAQ